MLAASASVAVLGGCAGAGSRGITSTLPSSMVQIDTPLRSEPDGQLKGHLYVASSGEVERFRIVHGVPLSNPDRTYSAEAPLAVDSQGYLYATTGGGYSCGSSAGSSGFSVYPPNSTSPVRTLYITAHSNEFLGITSLFVDRQGYAYVGLSATLVGNVSSAWSVNVYAPSASGCNAPVLHTFDSGGCKLSCYGVTGLAMDAQANLHASNNLNGSPDGVLSFESPITDPSQTADITGPGIVSPWGLAVDASDELYVDNAGQGASSFVAVYPATANGSPKPDRKIRISGAQSFGNGIAVTAGRLIVPDNIASKVYDVLATRGGAQKPIWTLSLPPGFSPQDVKLGP